MVFQFHTRTKTARSRELNRAAAEVFAQLHEEDARRLGVKEGEFVEVTSRRGTVRARVRMGGIERGQVFSLPLWLRDKNRDEYHRAANELTVTAWDPVSKQPYFKYAAVRVEKARRRLVARAANLAAHVGDRVSELADKVLSTAPVERSRVDDGLGLLRDSHAQFAKGCRSVMATHLEEAEIQEGLTHLVEFSEQAAHDLEPYAERRP